MFRPRCINCDRTEDQHCDRFDDGLSEWLEGCKCDRRSWGSALGVKAICGRWESKRGYPECCHCEHDIECHPPVAVLASTEDKETRHE